MAISSAILSMSTVIPALALIMMLFGCSLLSDPWRSRLQAVAWTLALVVGGVLHSSRLPLPLLMPLDGLIWSAVLLGAFVVIGPRGVGLRYLVRSLLVVAIGVLVLWPILSTLQGQVHTRNLLAFFFLGLGLWSVVERATQSVRVPALLLLPLLSAIALLWFLFGRESEVVFVPVSLFTGVLAAVSMVALLFVGRVSAAAIVPFVSVLLVALMAAAHFYLQINPWSMVWLCAPFLLLWLRPWLPFFPKEPRREALTLGVLAALPLLYFLSQHSPSFKSLLA